MVTAHSLADACGQFAHVTVGPFAVSNTEELVS